MIVDMRVRPPTGPWIGKPQFLTDNYYPARAGFPRPPSAQQQSMPMLLSEMDAAGVHWGVIAGRQAAEPLGVVSNDAVAAVVAEHPDRFVAFAGIAVNDPPERAIAEIDRCLALPGFRGVMIEPAAAPAPMALDDRRLYPLYEHCANRRVPLTITLSLELVKLVSHSWTLASPLPLYQPARDFPTLQFVIAHGAWPFVQEMVGLAFVLPNVWLSPDLYMVGTDMPFALEYVNAANLYLSDRTLFGTGYPSRPHVESLRAFEQWPFAPGVAEKVLGRNALRLMGME
jgi:uncharacterized protein